MKIIISEDQLSKLEKKIYDYFDKHLTPFNGWSPADAKRIIYLYKEQFYPLEDTDDLDNTNHMWYSTCNNPDLVPPPPDGECPFIAIPENYYTTLTGYFGEAWKSYFMRWFHENTQLPIVKITFI